MHDPGSRFTLRRVSSGPLRILHCLATVYSGGVERRRLALAQHLDPGEFHQAILCTDAHGPLVGAFEQAGVEVRGLGDSPSLGARKIAAACSFARRYKPDIVHGAVFEGVITGAAVAAATGAIFIAEETSFATDRSWRGDLLFRALATRASKCVAVSSPVAELMRRRSQIPAEKILTILNGASVPETSLTPNQARERLGIPPESFVVASIGRMLSGAGKRFHDLVHATAASQESVVLLLGGDGPLQSDLQSLALRLGIAHRVVFAGFVERPGDLLRAADAFALVSERESFGLALAEAMLIGLPCIATRVGGMMEIITDSETGFHVRVGAIDEIASVIERLRTDDELREGVAQAGQRSAQRRLSVERYVADVASLYRSVGARQ